MKKYLFLVSILIFAGCFTSTLLKKTDKIVNAPEYKYYQNTSMWLNYWQKAQIKGKFQEYISIFRQQAISLFSRRMKELEQYIDDGDEYNTRTKSNEIIELFNQVLLLDPDFQKVNRIPNLKMSYLKNAVNLAKISNTNKFLKQKKFESWISKWEEFNRALNTDELTIFNSQSKQVLDTLTRRVVKYKASKNYFAMERNIDLAINIKRRILKINPNFEQYVQMNFPNLMNLIADNQLEEFRRTAKINVADHFAHRNKYYKWQRKWQELSAPQDTAEINSLNAQAFTIFATNIPEIKNSIYAGKYTHAGNLSSDMLDLYHYVKNLNPNFDSYKNAKGLKDLNDAFLKAAYPLAYAYNQINHGYYLKTIQNLVSEINVNDPNLKNYYSEIYNKTLKIVTEHYANSYNSGEKSKQVDNLHILKELSKITPGFISFKPSFLNDKNLNFKTWLEQRINATLQDYYQTADFLISNHKYEKAFDEIETVKKICYEPKCQTKIDNYHKIFQTQGTQFYLDSIESLISDHKYLLALNVIDIIKKINPYFSQVKEQALRDRIKREGTDYYLGLRDNAIENKRWFEAQTYCDNIREIDGLYDYRQCKDEITFHKTMDEAQSNFDVGKYLRAKDQAEKVLDLRIPETMKAQARKFIKDCEEKATIVVQILPAVNNSDASDYNLPFVLNDLTSYLQNKFTANNKSKYIKVVSSSVYTSQVDDILRGNCSNYSRNHPNVDYVLIVSVTNYDYDYGWKHRETKYACKVYYDTREEYRTEKQEKKQIIDGITYYIVEDENGHRFYAYQNAYGYWFIKIGTQSIPLDWNYYHYVYEEVQVKYPQDYTKVYKVSYTQKTGSESMNLTLEFKLVDVKNCYQEIYKSENFSHSRSYVKNYYSGDYKQLKSCKSGITYNTWIKGYIEFYSLPSDEREAFRTSDNPFKGKQKFYKSYFQDDVEEFLSKRSNEALRTLYSKIDEMR